MTSGIPEAFKGLVHPKIKKFCHHLLTLMSFQIGKTLVLTATQIPLWHFMKFMKRLLN